MDKDEATLFTRRQIAEFTRWDIKTVKKYLDECLDQGLIEIKVGGRGSAYEYSLVRLPDKYDNLLLHPDQLREIIQSQQLSNLSTPIQNAIGQVNMLTDNKLDAPVQPVQGNKDVRMKTKRKDAGAI